METFGYTFSPGTGILVIHIAYTAEKILLINDKGKSFHAVSTAYTDSNGYRSPKAIFPALPPGNYTVWNSARKEKVTIFESQVSFIVIEGPLNNY